MIEPVDLVRTSFSIYPKHIGFLEEIDKDNQSLALRTILNSSMRIDKRRQQKEIADKSLLFISLGLVFLIFSFVVSNITVVFVSIGIGVFLFAYGGIGGVLNALPRTNKRTQL